MDTGHNLRGASIPPFAGGMDDEPVLDPPMLSADPSAADAAPVPGQGSIRYSGVDKWPRRHGSVRWCGFVCRPRKRASVHLYWRSSLRRWSSSV